MDVPDLVRSEGKTYATGPCASAETFIAAAPLSRDSKSADARKAEAAYGLGDSLYFFAGHACPTFGDFVLVYEPHIFDGAAGNAGPVDSGGLFLGFVHARQWDSLPGPEQALARRAFILDRLEQLPDWRAACDRDLMEFFDDRSSYVLGRPPDRDDPIGRMHHPLNERRAWTWEVRVHADHPLRDGLKRVWMSADLYEACRQQMIARGGAAPWTPADFGHIVRPAGAGERPHPHAEKEIASWL